MNTAQPQKLFHEEVWPQQNIFNHQSKLTENHNRRTAREEDARQRRQDKGHLGNAPRVAGQPAPLLKGSGARAVKTKIPRTQKTTTDQGKRVHSTFHLEPGVRADMDRIATEKGLSLSEVGNMGWKFYAEASLADKYKASLKTELRHIIREELAAFGHRIVYFLLRIAFAAEHARLLITNVLKILLQTRGKYDEKHFNTLVDATAKTAKRNILRNNPQMKATLAEFWASFTEAKDGEKEGNP
jgi:hypothetical protein